MAETTRTFSVTSMRRKLGFELWPPNEIWCFGRKKMHGQWFRNQLSAILTTMLVHWHQPNTVESYTRLLLLQVSDIFATNTIRPQDSSNQRKLARWFSKICNIQLYVADNSKSIWPRVIKFYRNVVQHV